MVFVRKQVHFPWESYWNGQHRVPRNYTTQVLIPTKPCRVAAAIVNFISLVCYFPTVTAKTGCVRQGFDLQGCGSSGKRQKKRQVPWDAASVSVIQFVCRFFSCCNSVTSLWTCISQCCVLFHREERTGNRERWVCAMVNAARKPCWGLLL